ncbi:hypothetical protein H7C19_05160 [Cohnella nanjingensis]|uniref:Uncharacterized protein n=1 Tax=Cohnella nanjingensis TaxID=1387779 RepID=A0A7X0RMG1_9BACL|nr:hypothetical protein [Cohnella nanjingensis]MBB6670071.1 hypothetical protein [Cohnella nanjingensis]
MLGDGALVGLSLPADDRLNPGEFHEPQDAFVVNRLVHLSDELDGMPPVAVNALYLGMKCLHVLRQLLVFLLPQTRLVANPFVIAGPLNSGNLSQKIFLKIA